MDLKFTFGGASSGHDAGHGAEHDAAHDHGDTPGIPLPFAGATGASASGTLELRVSLDAETGTLVCEGLSGDGVSYARAEKATQDRSPAALAAATRSALARCGAELPEPLIGSVTAVVLALGGAEAAVLAEFGLATNQALDPAAAVASVDDALQARTGIASGTPIRIAV